MFRRRRPRWTSSLHYWTSGGDAYHKNRTPRSYSDEVLHLASMDGDQLREVLAQTPAFQGGWPTEVIEGIERAREDDAKRRVRQGLPKLPERDEPSIETVEDFAQSVRNDPALEDLRQAVAEARRQR